MNMVEEHWVTMDEYVQDALEQGREEGKGEALLDLYEDNVLTYTQLLAYSQLNKEELDHLIEQRQAERGEKPVYRDDDEWEL